MSVRLTAWVHGQVQGVGFRWWTRARALELGLTGYAKNQPDGRVLVIAQGPRESCEALLELLEECKKANGEQPITFFEITTAAAFLAFSRDPADVLLLEVGLGGRLDATNVIAKPALTVITPIAMDHMQYLGDSIEAIAAEKAGIFKPGVPVVRAGPSRVGARRPLLRHFRPR